MPTGEVPLWLSFGPVFQQLPPLISTYINTVASQYATYVWETGFKIIEVMVGSIFNQQPCTCTDRWSGLDIAWNPIGQTYICTRILPKLQAYMNGMLL